MQMEFCKVALWWISFDQLFRRSFATAFLQLVYSLSALGVSLVSLVSRVCRGFSRVKLVSQSG